AQFSSATVSAGNLVVEASSQMAATSLRVQNGARATLNGRFFGDELLADAGGVVDLNSDFDGILTLSPTSTVNIGASAVAIENVRVQAGEGPATINKSSDEPVKVAIGVHEVPLGSNQVIEGGASNELLQVNARSLMLEGR